MGEEESMLQDFERLICLRNQLVNASIPQLLAEYEDYESYESFLSSVLLLKDVDSGFLLLDDSFKEKILTIIQIYRFENPSKNAVKAINEIIDYVNQIRTYSDVYRKALKEGYICFHEDARKANFSEEESLIYSLAYDALVYMALKNGEMDIITEGDMFYASMNYFMDMIPEFLERPEIHQRAMKKLQEFSNSLPFHRSMRAYAKQTKEAFEKIKVREE